MPLNVPVLLDQQRIVRRATVVGEIPVGVDGRASVNRRKTPKPVPAPVRETAAA
jgi:taurine dioxygenase